MIPLKQKAPAIRWGYHVQFHARAFNNSFPIHLFDTRIDLTNITIFTYQNKIEKIKKFFAIVKIVFIYLLKLNQTK